MTDQWPFRGAEAVASGVLTPRQLGQFYVAVYPGVYVPRWLELSAPQRARAAWLWSRGHGVIAGLSASAMLGAKWIEPTLPAELAHSNRRAPKLLVVHSDALHPTETVVINGMTVTTPARTAFDIGRRLADDAGVQRLDALTNATGLRVGGSPRSCGGAPGSTGAGNAAPHARAG